MKQNYKRRSISIPIALEELINYKFKMSGYTYINDMIVELLELGLLKLNEDDTIKVQNEMILKKLDELILLQKNGF